MYGLSRKVTRVSWAQKSPMNAPVRTEWRALLAVDTKRHISRSWNTSRKSRFCSGLDTNESEEKDAFADKKSGIHFFSE